MRFFKDFTSQTVPSMYDYVRLLKSETRRRATEMKNVSSGRLEPLRRSSLPDQVR